MFAIIALAVLAALVGIAAGKNSRNSHSGEPMLPPPPPPPPTTAAPSPRTLRATLAAPSHVPTSPAHPVAHESATATPNTKLHGPETPANLTAPTPGQVALDFAVGVTFNVSGLERLFVNERDLYQKMRDFVARTITKMNQHWASSGTFVVKGVEPSQKDYGYEVICNLHYSGASIPRADIIAYVRQQVTSLGNQIASRLRDVYLDET